MIIRARNAVLDLERCLPAVRDQHLPDGLQLELILVDNDSQDGSRRLSEAHGARVVPIAVRDFTWGRALNRGIAATDAEIVLLLSADATPVNDQWLAEMVRPFADDRVAAVYGRQEPRHNAPIDEVVRLRRAFDAHPRELTIQQVEEDLMSHRWVCSNACAAVRRSVWEKLPFDEEAPASEEVPWIRSVLRSGFHAVYMPTARVYHSHREGILRYAIRALEFHRKDIRDRRTRRFGALRAAALMARHRVENCMTEPSGLRAAMAGLVRLPFECLALLSVALVSRQPVLYEWLRRRSR